MASSGGATFVLTKDEISPAFRQARQRMRSFISKTTTYHANRAETYSRLHALWTDRTGNARQGLTAFADHSRSGSNHWEIVLFHTMPYGLWLEVRWSGKYAIIRPTIEREAPEYWETCRDLLLRMFPA